MQGFDPLGFTTTITELGGDLNYVREAELMHGRQAMLATVGFVAPALFGKLPVAWTEGVSVNPLEAQYQLPPEVLYQVAASIFIAEGLRARIIFGEDRAPGVRILMGGAPWLFLLYRTGKQHHGCSPWSQGTTASTRSGSPRACRQRSSWS